MSHLSWIVDALSVSVVGALGFYCMFRFVTRPELDSLGMGHLVGTNLLRAYMHGFFMHNKLFQKAKAISAPVDYATVRKERIQSKMEADRAQRITLKRKLPKVVLSWIPGLHSCRI